MQGADADGDINPERLQIKHGIRKSHIEFDLGVLGEERRDGRSYVPPCQSGRSCDPQQAGRFFILLPERCHGTLHLIKHSLGVLLKDLPLRGEGDVTRCAVKKGDAQALLQTGHALAGDRRGKTKCSARGGEVAALGGAQEEPEIIRFHYYQPIRLSDVLVGLIIIFGAVIYIAIIELTLGVQAMSRIDYHSLDAAEIQALMARAHTERSREAHRIAASLFRWLRAPLARTSSHDSDIDNRHAAAC